MNLVPTSSDRSDPSRKGSPKQGPASPTAAEAAPLWSSAFSQVLSTIGRALLPDEKFPVQASVLSGDALAERLLSQYGFKAPIICRFQSKELNDMYTVSLPTTAQTHYLRIYRHGFWSKEQIAAEASLLCSLHGADIPVSRPLQNRRGEILQELNCPEGTRYGVLFQGVGGWHPPEWNLEHCRLFGRGLASLHQALDGFNGKWDRPIYSSARAGWESIEKARPYFGVRQEDFDLLESTTRALAHYLDEKPNYPHGYGIVHGDLHAFNVKFDSRRAQFIDFDLCGYGPRAYDLASFVWGRLFVSSDSIEDMSARFDAVIEGYRELVPFPDEEKDRVSACLIFREIYRIGLDCDGPAAWGFRWLTAESWGKSLNFIQGWLDKHPHLLNGPQT